MFSSPSRNTTRAAHTGSWLDDREERAAAANGGGDGGRGLGRSLSGASARSAEEVPDREAAAVIARGALRREVGSTYERRRERRQSERPQLRRPQCPDSRRARR